MIGKIFWFKSVRSLVKKTEEQNQQVALNEHYGEVAVAIQQFKGAFRCKLKRSDNQHEKRFA